MFLQQTTQWCTRSRQTAASQIYCYTHCPHTRACVCITGATKRSRPQTSGADSPPNAESALSKRQKGPASHRGHSGLERLVSLGTVLQCVDTKNDREGSFDSAVGQRPATVHEVTAGLPSLSASNHLCWCNVMDFSQRCDGAVVHRT